MPHPSPRLNGKIIAAVLLYVALGIAGDLTLRYAMRQVPPPTSISIAEIGRLGAYVASSTQVKIGIALLALNFTALLALLSFLDVSIVGPARAISYLFLTLLAWLILGERVTPLRWAGVALITAGVAVILSTAHGSQAPTPHDAGA